MAKKYYGGIDIQTNSKLRLFESTGANFTSLRSPASMAADLDLRLPATDLASGAMVSDGSGNLSLALILNANIDAAAAIAYSKLNLNASIVNADIVAGVDAAKIADGSVSNAEFQYINTLSSNAQTQIDAKATKALDNLTVASLAAGSLLIGSSSSAVTNLAVGSNGQVLTVSGGTPVWAAASGEQQTALAASWITADGASKVITHNFASNDFLFQIWDTTSGAMIEIDSAVQTDNNTLTLTASEAPAASWRVLLLKI